MSIGVLLICLYYNIKIKGFCGWVHELSPRPSVPIPSVSDQLPDADDRIPAKTVSHGMRLFGNMYAGELVFMLIALMGRFGSATVFGFLGTSLRAPSGPSSTS